MLLCPSVVNYNIQQLYILAYEIEEMFLKRPECDGNKPTKLRKSRRPNPKLIAYSPLLDQFKLTAYAKLLG